LTGDTTTRDDTTGIGVADLGILIDLCLHREQGSDSGICLGPSTPPRLEQAGSVLALPVHQGLEVLRRLRTYRQDPNREVVSFLGRVVRSQVEPFRHRRARAWSDRLGDLPNPLALRRPGGDVGEEGLPSAGQGAPQ